MLQVGSFAQRAEAEAFASGFAAERPIVVTSELPGKGTWFRVRVGGFANFKEAVDAKLAFERRYNKIALVIGPL
ncbi:MAG TPA: SPOR domain-containing protein [Polyangia bacterium]